MNMKESKKRKIIADIEEVKDAKKSKANSEVSDIMDNRVNGTAGKILKMVLRNILCHDALEIDFNENVNFIVGKNGSGKSAILAGITVGLGARASVTNRAESMQDLIKNGRSKGSVEITLSNVGPLAYHPEKYGDKLTVVRTIGATSSYKIKDAHGKVISSKKHNLDTIVRGMNIQVENPISVLNQKQSREFLRDATPKSMYELFMKATQLELIGNNYKDSVRISVDSQTLLDETSRQLAADMKEVMTLEENLKIIDSLGDVETQLRDFDNELHWSIAIGEEEKLTLLKDILTRREKSYENLQTLGEDHDEKINEINAQIESLEMEIQSSNDDSRAVEDNYTRAKNEALAKREEINSKVRDHKTIQRQLRQWQDEVNDLTAEIKKLEGGQSDVEQKRMEQKQRLCKMQSDIYEVEAMLRTKQIEMGHLETEKFHLESQVRSMEIELRGFNEKINKMKNQLNDLKQQSGDALTVFGRNVPRLLKRIDEEFKKGRFHAKPRGPLGHYIKMKDEAWTPAVEAHLGQSFLTGYCVDNAHDAKVLTNLMIEVFHDGGIPNIMCSKFHKRIHDVSGRTSSTVDYPCLIDVMEINDPIVANCIIDQREPECIQLITTSREAKDMMGNSKFVPINCKRAITQKGDTFYPVPHYRFYGGKVAPRPRWLQVSTKEAIQTLQEELTIAENDKERIAHEYALHRDKLQCNLREVNNLQDRINKLETTKNKLKSTIEVEKDTIIEEPTNNCDLFKADKVEKLLCIENGRERENELREQVKLLNQQYEELEGQVANCRQVHQEHNNHIVRIKRNICELKNAKRQVESNANDSKLQLELALEEINQAKTHVHEQNEKTTKLIAQAQLGGPRVETNRTPTQISRSIKKLKIQVETVEKKVGSRQQLMQELMEKRKKTHDVFDFKNALTKVVAQHLTRVDTRKNEYLRMKRFMGHKVKNAFSSILSLRNYVGSIEIDHGGKELKIDVTPSNTEKRTVSDVQTLSGGERSYSTVAFVLALWECTTLPFYFLDEFDVFMDKVNRRVIMDLLMDHTKEHPERQFGFLTPLDASLIKADDYVTIHRLAEPERGDTQQ